jgi:(p)ppGpp synthase/HD superfamily hydrolase
MNRALNWSQEKYIRAYRFAAKAHRGQLFPGTGLSYLMHLSFVSMEIIAAMAVEEAAHPDLAVQCALLHDVLEDTKIGYQKIEEVFGKEVADGVCALTKKKEIGESQQLPESLERILKQPHEVWMVKLADRISNLQPPPFDWTQEKIKAYWESSKEIYAALKDASTYLGERLLKQIEIYSANYIK